MIDECRRNLPAPFGHVVANDIVGDVTTFRQADSRRRDFWASERLPARLVAVGDAVASFNPLYGQGMSSAALHASALSMYLRSSPDLDAPARDFFALQRVVVDAAWQMSTSPEVNRASTPDTSSFVRQIVEASVTDSAVNTAFQEVTQMLRHPSTLSDPQIVSRVLGAQQNDWPAPTLPLAPEPR
jgi:2-polyprenyl-6-methoxyphenol hydroxylase-like FAD-dependent oxidoreductase